MCVNMQQQQHTKFEYSSNLLAPFVLALLCILAVWKKKKTFYTWNEIQEFHSVNTLENDLII